MDPLIYVAMSGAERALHAQQVRANNLANLDTPGFRASMELATSQPVPGGHGYDARHLGALSANAISGREGAMRQTGRELDVAISGPGLLAVQWGDGEAYTRGGAMAIDADGALTIGGRPVMGEGGPIVLPPYAALSIGADGTISALMEGDAAMQVVDRLKLVRADAADLTKNEAGLIVSRTGGALDADDNVSVRGGFLEGSNVSAVEEMVATMGLTRDFEVQMKLFKAADGMAEAGNRLIRE